MCWPILTCFLALAACGGQRGPIDADFDGFYEAIDCDDGDPAVSPGAHEVPGDGQDNDCDGAVDCDDPDLTGEWKGDVTLADLPRVCAGFCSGAVRGSIVLDETPLTDLPDLTGLRVKTAHPSCGSRDRML